MQLAQNVNWYFIGVYIIIQISIYTLWVILVIRANWLVHYLGLFNISKIQLVVYYQSCVLIGWATTGLYVIAH